MKLFKESYRVDPKTGCWNWLRNFSNGYGVFERKRAHRISYKMHNGIIPKNLVICHKCDNKRCVNPNHLFVGTQSDNIQDCWNKGRREPAGAVTMDRKGSKHPQATITEEIVLEMRRLKGAGIAMRQIAISFEIPYTTAYCAIVGLSWKHI